LCARNRGFANAGHNLRADYGVGDFEAKLINDGGKANWGLGLPVPVVSHKIAPWAKITSQNKQWDINSSLGMLPSSNEKHAEIHSRNNKIAPNYTHKRKNIPKNAIDNKNVPKNLS
jgi:hypothetical protein